MAADFLFTGSVDLFVQMRHLQPNWYFLGTAVTAPEIRSELLTYDITSSRSGAAPVQKVEASERHVVTAVLNRLNWRTFNRLRATDPLGSDISSNLTVGRLVMNVKDCELFIRHQIPADDPTLVPDGASYGRLYYSARLARYRETPEVNRVQEVAVLFECDPIWYAPDREWWFWTEDDQYLPDDSELTLE